MYSLCLCVLEWICLKISGSFFCASNLAIRLRFVVLDNQDYIEKIDYQLGRILLERLDHSSSELFSKKVDL